MTKLFADTYALVEILKGNPAYEKISQEELVTLESNIFELAYDHLQQQDSPPSCTFLCRLDYPAMVVLSLFAGRETIDEAIAMARDAIEGYIEKR